MNNYDTRPSCTIKQLSDHIEDAIANGSPNNAEWMYEFRQSIQAKKVESMEDIWLQDAQLNGGEGIFEDNRIIWD